MRPLIFVVLGTCAIGLPGTSDRAESRREVPRSTVPAGERPAMPEGKTGVGVIGTLPDGPATACTLRVVPADATIDEDFARPTERKVDSGMVVRSRCIE